MKTYKASKSREAEIKMWDIKRDAISKNRGIYNIGHQHLLNISPHVWIILALIFIFTTNIVLATDNQSDATETNKGLESTSE